MMMKRRVEFIFRIKKCVVLTQIEALEPRGAGKCDNVIIETRCSVVLSSLKQNNT